MTNGTQYSCTVIATNNFGPSPASNTVVVTPFTIPAAPVLSGVTSANGAAVVAFSTPASNGAAITGYKASCQSSSGTFSGSATTSPISVAGLSGGATYSCTVVATNAAGDSPASNAMDIAIAAAPGAPTIGAASAGNGSISVAFTAPASDGGAPITGYTASCRVGTGPATSASGTTSPISVTGLTNGSSHTCSVTATNSAGASVASGTVSATPVGPPGAPTIGNATPADGAASISFTAPSSTGGSAITSYTATCSAGGTIRTATGNSTPIVVSTLVNGTQYSCSVTATNAIGTGAASTALPVTPREVPGAPTNVTATAGNGSASIAFTAPAATGGSSISGYTVTCMATGATTRTGTGTASPITVTVLTNGTTYSCSVTATNAAGAGAASSAVSVTPTSGTTSASTAGVLCSYSYDQINSIAALQSKVTWSCTSTTRTVSSTQIPDYPSAKSFAGNPNVMSVQTTPLSTTFTMTPALTGTATARGNVVGWAKNGVKFDPATAEVCPGQSYCPSGTTTTTYNVEALGQSLFSAGVDGSNAHIQPNGSYHYHGMPTGYMSWISSAGTSTTASIAVQHYLVGFAVDGFPIYAKYGYSDPNNAASTVREIKSGWRKKTTGELTSERINLNTTIGTFTQDWVYDLTGSGGDLDECNGRFAKTPDFPNGIYHYYITTDFPYITRCLKGTVPTTGPNASLTVPARRGLAPPSAARRPRR